MAFTVLDLFINATNQFGLPSRVRVVQGVGNVDIARSHVHLSPSWAP